VKRTGKEDFPMRLIRVGRLWLFLLVVSPAVVWAQTPLEFDVRVGPAITLGDFSDVADTGAFLSGTVLARVAPPLSAGLEIGGNLGHSKGSRDTTIFQLTPVARISAPLAGGGLVYLLFGAGYYRTEYELGSSSDSHNDFGVNVGAGVLIPITPRMSLGLDLRYHHLFESGSDPEYLVPGVIVTFKP
jgi:hypothetical protein